VPSASKISTQVAVDEEEIEGRYAPLDDYTVAFEAFRLDADPADYFVGLPDNRCQCPHWGVVVEGQMTFRWQDHEETYVAGDAYYAPPGHLPLVTAGTSIVEFSPTEGLAETMSVVRRNLAGAGADA